MAFKFFVSIVDVGYFGSFPFCGAMATVPNTPSTSPMLRSAGPAPAFGMEPFHCTTLCCGASHTCGYETGASVGRAFSAIPKSPAVTSFMMLPSASTRPNPGRLSAGSGFRLRRASSRSLHFARPAFSAVASAPTFFANRSNLSGWSIVCVMDATNSSRNVCVSPIAGPPSTCTATPLIIHFAVWHAEQLRPRMSRPSTCSRFFT